MKNQKAVSLIALIITIIVIIILAAIVMMASGETVDEANFAGYAQELGDYTSAVQTSALSIKADYAVDGTILNDAQMYWLLANKSANASAIASVQLPAGAQNMTTPAGKKMTTDLAKALEKSDKIETVAVYLIDNDTNIQGYTKNPFVFYGNSNGAEKHYVTSDGTVFTLPGFPQTQEGGAVRYYVTPDAYYTVGGSSSVTAPITDASLGAFAAKTTTVTGG